MTDKVGEEYLKTVSGFLDILLDDLIASARLLEGCTDSGWTTMRRDTLKMARQSVVSYVTTLVKENTKTNPKRRIK